MCLYVNIDAFSCDEIFKQLKILPGSEIQGNKAHSLSNYSSGPPQYGGTKDRNSPEFPSTHRGLNGPIPPQFLLSAYISSMHIRNGFVLNTYAPNTILVSPYTNPLVYSTL